MALRNVRKDGDPVLRKLSRTVTQFDDKLKELAADMVETMYHEDGVGLAAVQVGILKRLIVIDLYDDTGVKYLVNPEIVDQKGSQLEIEGCLSVPGRNAYVARPSWVKVTGQNLDGDEITYEAEGLFAIALCHEIDHTNGILFIDKMVEEVKD